MANHTPELLAPAGSFETARAAFAAGADAVYLGLDSFSARAEAVNFSLEDLQNLLALARRDHRKVYVTFNTLLDQADLTPALEQLARLSELGPDALIVQDLGVARLIRRHFPTLALHASTQLVAHNLAGVYALRDLGFTRVVPSRELSAAEIATLCKRGGVEIEVFVHGALCYSLSGLCLFSAMEKERSGNRGRCAYCCRLSYTDAAGTRALPFSMRDLRLDDALPKLSDAGVASLKIEGRMKSALYVASAVRHYRELLDGRPSETTRADLETVFSRRTTHLYIDGAPTRKSNPEAVIDPTSLGHLGTPVGTLKRLTRDREGRAWLRFHTSRTLERHDGLQFAVPGDRPFGFGIAELREAISRRTLFAVPAGTDVEVLVPPEALRNAAPEALRPGAAVYCSASNAVKRRFPIPPFRPSEAPAGTPIDVTLALAPEALRLSAKAPGSLAADLTLPVALTSARTPERTAAAARSALAKLGGTDWTLAAFTLVDPQHLFVPATILNDARRNLVAKLDDARLKARTDLLAAASRTATEDAADFPASVPLPSRVLKLRLNQDLPSDAASYDETVIAIGHASGKDAETLLKTRFAACVSPRLALPVFTHESDFSALRTSVKHLLRAGFARWEAADLATLRLLRELGVTDLTADWTLYAFNRPARAQLAEFGIRRQVVSPETTPENQAYLEATAATPGLPVCEFLIRQSTPLFISLTRPATTDPSDLTGLAGDRFTSFYSDGLWLTTRPEPRRFAVSGDSALIRRTDLSWDA